MIRFSAALVAVAIGVLIGGIATSKLLLVYIAIVVSAVALVALAIGVVLKREELFGEGQGLVPAGAGASPVLSARAGESAGSRDKVPASAHVAPPPPFQGAAAGYGAAFGGTAAAAAPPAAADPAAARTAAAGQGRSADPVPPWETRRRASRGRRRPLTGCLPGRTSGPPVGRRRRRPCAVRVAGHGTGRDAWRAGRRLGRSQRRCPGRRGRAPVVGRAVAALRSPDAPAVSSRAPGRGRPRRAGSTGWAASRRRPPPRTSAPPPDRRRLVLAGDAATPTARPGGPAAGSTACRSRRRRRRRGRRLADPLLLARRRHGRERRGEARRGRDGPATGPARRRGRRSPAPEAAAPTRARPPPPTPTPAAGRRARHARPPPDPSARRNRRHGDPGRRNRAAPRNRRHRGRGRRRGSRRRRHRWPAAPATPTGRARPATPPRRRAPSSRRARRGRRGRRRGAAKPGRAAGRGGRARRTGAALVAVVRGVPRYHEADCVLIRFMPEGDVQKLTVPQAKEDGLHSLRGLPARGITATSAGGALAPAPCVACHAWLASARSAEARRAVRQQPRPARSAAPGRRRRARAMARPTPVAARASRRQPPPAPPPAGPSPGPKDTASTSPAIIGAVLGERRRQAGVRRRPAHHDPVADIEPGGLPRLLDQPDDLTRVALGAQRVGHGQVERDGLAAARRPRPSPRAASASRRGPRRTASPVPPTGPPRSPTRPGRPRRAPGPRGRPPGSRPRPPGSPGPNRRPRERNSGLTV